MEKTYVEDIKLTATRNKIFASLVDKKQVNIFEAITLSSGDYLPTQKMIQGEYNVYGGGGITVKKHNEYNVKNETFGIGRVGARCGCVFEIKPKSWVTDNALYAIKIDDSFDIDFLIHFLNFKNLNQFANTAAQPVISLKRISGITLPKIDLKMQQEIVEILNRIEAGLIKIDNDKYGIRQTLNFVSSKEKLSTELTHQLILVKKLRQQLLQDAVQGKLVKQHIAKAAVEEVQHVATVVKVPKKQTTENIADEPASELLKRIKALKDKNGKNNKPLPPIKPEEIPFEIPENWVWCRLGEICDTITKGSSPNWQGVQYVEEEKGILFITSKNVDSFKIDLTKATYVEEKFNEIEPRSILKKGDLLTNIVGASIGRTALFDLDVIANINQAVCILRIEHDLINKDYLLNLMNSDLALKMMFESQFAPGRANLSMGNIASFTIPIPPLSEQNRIVQKLDELMQYCNELEKSIQQSELQNEKLLQQVLREALRG